ncbi:hypothetical protein BDR22DRAFT_841118, partial [Usnea florida]
MLHVTLTLLRSFPRKVATSAVSGTTELDLLPVALKVISFRVDIYFLSLGNHYAKAIPQIEQECLDPQAQNIFAAVFNCRERDHLVKMWPEDWSGDEFGWFLSDMRETMDSTTIPGHLTSFCNRCKELDLLNWLRQDTTTSVDRDRYRRTFRRNHRQVFRKLGRIGSIVLRNDCRLCRRLFGLTPSPC